MKLKISIMIIFIILTIKPCLAQNPWSMYRHDPKHTGKSQFQGPSVPEEKWHFFINNTEGFSSPAITNDGSVYIGSLGGNCLWAINPDGSEKWHFDCNFISSSPCIDSDSIIYVGSGQKLYAINPNGTEKWQYPTNGPIMNSSPVVDSNGTIYIGSSDSCLYAINNNGTYKWKYHTNGPVYSSPALISNGSIYIGSCDGGLYAINNNGSFGWRYNTGGAINTSPAIDDSGIIYFGSSDHYFYALHPNGILKWRILLGGSINTSCAIDNNGIYVGCDDGYLYAFSAADSIRWQFKVDDYAVYASPVVDNNGVIYIGGSNSNILFAINPDGIERWRYPTLGSFYSSFAIDNNNCIYFQTYYPAYIQSIKESNKIEEKSGKEELNYLNISPNITADYIMVSMSSTSENNISLCMYDITGIKIKTIYEGISKTGINKLKVTPPKESGIYFLALKLNEQLLCKKILKLN